MAILDNLEAYLEFNLNQEKCHYCHQKAKYTDVAQVDHNKYDMVGLCRCHLSMEASS